MLILSIVTLLGVKVYADTSEDFASNQSYYKELCRNYSSSDAQTCQAFKEWLEKSIKNEKDSISDLKDQISANNKAIEEQQTLLSTYIQEIEVASDEISQLETEISIKEEEIVVLEEEIEVKKENIATKEEQVLTYLETAQTSMRTNNYIGFVMGASDFSEMMRRSAGFNAIKEYNEEIIVELNQEKVSLEEDQVQLVNIQNQLIVDKDIAQVKKDTTEEKKAVVEILVSNIRKENQNIADTIEQQEEKQSLSSEALASLGPASNSGGGGGGGGTLPPSGGWGPIVDGSYRISAGVWEYDDGWGNHFGTDFAAAVGTPLIAPGNGLITVVSGGCPTYGGYPNSCNGGWGNYVTMIVNIEGTIYGVLMAHQRADSFAVSPGEIVSTGTKIGEVGSSGASTGPHMHLEIYYLGNDSIADAYNRWTGSNTFGTGSASAGSWDKLCHNNGNQYPCRMNPQIFY